MTIKGLTAAEMLVVLFAEQVDVADKAAAFERSLMDWGAGPTREGRVRAAMVWAAPLQALPPDPAARGELAKVVQGLAAHRYAERLGRKTELAATLQGLAQGTRGIMHPSDGEPIGVFERCDRTRLLARFDDGELYNVPLQLFVRVADDAAATSQSGVQSSSVA